MARQFYTIGAVGINAADYLPESPPGWFPAAPSAAPVLAQPVPRPDRGPVKGWPKPAVLARSWLPSGQYTINTGDTLSGLARTYLGDFAKWSVIWNLQPASFKNSARRVAQAKARKQNLADVIWPGEVLEMPPEAIAEARRQGLLVWHDEKVKVPHEDEEDEDAVRRSPGKWIAGLAAVGFACVGVSENFWLKKGARR